MKFQRLPNEIRSDEPLEDHELGDSDRRIDSCSYRREQVNNCTSQKLHSLFSLTSSKETSETHSMNLDTITWQI